MKVKKTILQTAEIPRPPRRLLRPRLQEVKYNFSDTDERDQTSQSYRATEAHGYVCVSADPRRAGTVKGGETFILTKDELKIPLQEQCHTEDQRVWLTTVQGFPTVPEEGELRRVRDIQLGRPTARHLHPSIIRVSVFILELQDEISTQNRSPCQRRSESGNRIPSS